MKKNIGNIIIIFLMIINLCLADNWGAFYFDRNTGITGGSYNFSTKTEARQGAQKSCINKHQKKGIKPNCIHYADFANTCAAVFWSSSDKKSGWAYSVFEKDAKNAAYRYCVKDGGKDCQLSLVTCTDRIIY